MQGIPLSLSGVRKIMERMDWGEVEEFVTFGQVSVECLLKCVHVRCRGSSAMTPFKTYFWLSDAGIACVCAFMQPARHHELADSGKR